MQWLWDLLYALGGLVLGAVIGFLVARKLMKKELKKNPPINEQMIRKDSMKKKYTLKEFYELERKIFELRISVKKGNFSNELREKLTTLEIEYERISSQISWDIENCNIDYGYEDNNKELKRVKKI